MQPPTNPLVEAAVKPLSGNAEYRLAAISILAENADSNHPFAAKTIARWEKVDAKKQSFIWKPLLYIAALLTAIAMIAFQGPDLKLAMDYRNAWDSWDFPEARIPEGLTASEKNLLGDPSKSEFDQKETLYQSNTENPAYYAEYASAYRDEFGNLPDDYLETVSRIATKNSYFLYSAAGLTVRGILEQKPSAAPRSPRTIKGVPVSPESVEDDYVILDQTAFDEALSLLQKASSLPEYETYWTAMKKARLQAMPRRGTFAERVNKILIISRGAGGISSINSVTNIIATQAQQLSRAGDAEGFLALVKIREHYIRSMASSPDSSLLNEVLFVMSASITAEYLHYSAERLGLDEMSEKYLAECHALRDSNDRSKIRRGNTDESWLTERGSPTTVSLGLGFLSADSPPPLTVENLAPTRYADHALVMRGGLAALATLLIPISLFVFFFRFAFPSALRKTSERLTQLLRPMDWLIIIFLGTVLPFAAILAIQQLTDLGGREWAVNHFQFLFPGVHLVTILILVLLAPVFLIRWRLSKRIAPFGIPCRPGIMSLLALVAVTALPFAAYPVAMKFGSAPLLIKALATVPAFWLCIVLWNFIQVFIAKATNRISLAATSMALLPAYAVAIILVALALPLFRASEENWLAKDTIHNFDSDSPEDGLYEHRLAAQKRKETLAILGLN